MATATKAMQAAGIASDPRKVQQTMMEFSKENAKMEAAQGESEVLTFHYAANLASLYNLPSGVLPSMVGAPLW